jgi:hypothetical protein
MKRRALVFIAAALATELVTPPVSAKGPIEALLQGPGLDTSLRFELPYHSAADDPRRAPLEHLALATGYFTAVFSGVPADSYDAASRALRVEPPPSDLGPRYTLTYRLEGPAGGERIVQDVYPFAEPRPLTYVAPSQVANQLGSWFVALPGLKHALVDAGLPQNPQSGHDGSPSPRTLVGVLGAIAVALGLGGTGLAVARRRLPPAT